MNLSHIVHSAAAIRLRQRLLPEGGLGDKIFPPTFAGGVYCWEQRRVEGKAVPCVLLDSVASQANRFEEAIADAIDIHRIEVPRLVVRFDGELAGIGEISTLAAPHRIFDAIFRDSSLEGKPFFRSPLYLKLTACNVRNATALLAHSPTALLFGCWDSTGAAGGMGNKFARAVTSEIVGINAEWGVTRGGVRRDPLNISSDVEISLDDAGEWAVVGKNKAGKKERAKGTRPSEINHGNVLVKVDPGTNERLVGDQLVSQNLPLRGGATIDYALQTTVLSLTALRRMRFPVNDDFSASQDAAARTLLAALGLVAITVARDRGYWLRSRCGLVADGAQGLEVVNPDGTTFMLAIDTKFAIDAYCQAIIDAKRAGLPWAAEPIALQPQAKLTELVLKSREIQSLGG
jgi:CRISPR-associated protein Csb1